MSISFFSQPSEGIGSSMSDVFGEAGDYDMFFKYLIRYVR